MRTFTLVAAVLVLSTVGTACAPEENAPSSRLRRGGSTGGSDPVGEDNANGEHGANTPAGPDAPPPEGTPVGNETWADGKKIDANITISAGATVTIAPGAVVTVATGVAITVKGKLTVAATTTHSKLTGTNWTGLVIGNGGTLEADGLDIENAASALWTQAGNVDAKLTNGNISAATPFKMEAGSKLSIAKSKVKATAGSAIAGTFTASFMEYDKGTNAGLTLNDPAGSMTFSDSTLKGGGGGDYVISSAGKLVKIEYTTISGSHCGLHFTAVDQFILDHVSDDTNSYGAMLYGSGAGPHSIISSNVRSTDKDLDMQGDNGPLKIDKSFTGGKNTLATNATVTNGATNPVADAKPRAVAP